MNEISARLERCGQCSERQQLTEELARLNLLNETIEAAEKIALDAAGSGKYGSVREMKAAWAHHLENWNIKTPDQQKRERFDDANGVANRYCMQIASRAAGRRVNDLYRETYQKCRSEHDPHQMMFEEEVAWNYCRSIFEQPRSFQKTSAGFTHRNAEQEIYLDFIFD